MELNNTNKERKKRTCEKPYKLEKMKYRIDYYESPQKEKIIKSDIFHSMDEIALHFNVEHDTIHRLIKKYYDRTAIKHKKKTYYLRCMSCNLIE
jgi:hypothetical protein